MCQTIKSLQSALALLEQELHGLHTTRTTHNHISDMYAEIHGMARALNHKKTFTTMPTLCWANPRSK